MPFVDLAAAAEHLGLSTDAIRQRIRRGKLASERRDGRLFVEIDTRPNATEHRPDTSEPKPDTVRTPSEHEGRNASDIALIAWLQERLEAAEVERAELRRLLGNAQQAGAATPTIPINLPEPARSATVQETSRLRHRPPLWQRLVHALRRA